MTLEEQLDALTGDAARAVAVSAWLEALEALDAGAALAVRVVHPTGPGWIAASAAVRVVLDVGRPRGARELAGELARLEVLALADDGRERPPARLWEALDGVPGCAELDAARALRWAR